MSQTITVPGVGDLEFPDGMSQPDMAAAIRKNFPQIHSDQGASAQAPQPGLLDRIGQSDIVQTLRHPVEAFKQQVLARPGDFVTHDLAGGAAAMGRGAFDASIGIPGMAADAVWQAKNRLTGTSDSDSPLPTQVINQRLDQGTGQVTGGNALLRGVSGAMLGSRIPLPGQPAAAPQRAAVPTAEQQAATDAQSLNADRDATLAMGRQAGLVVPPTAINPTLGTTALESAAGKAASRQGASAINQNIYNGLARSDLQLPRTAPLTREGISDMITSVGNATYGAIKKVGGTFTSDPEYQGDLQKILQQGQDLESAYPGIGAQAGEKVQSLVKSLDVPTHNPKDAVELFKYLRNQAKDNFSSAFAGDSTDGQALQLARAQSAAADAVKDMIKRNLIAKGQGALADTWDQGATQIAKGYQALGALKGNNINALSIAGQFRKDKPLSGGLGLIGRFADQFPEVSAVPKSGVGVSKLAATVGSAGIGTAVATGHPGLALLAAVGSAIPYGLRKMILSNAGQNALAKPNYGLGLMGPVGALSRTQMPAGLLTGSAPLLAQGLSSQ